MTKFHDRNYIEFLENSALLKEENNAELSDRFLGQSEHSDCPLFDGLFEYCQTYAGSSIGGAIKLNHKEADVSINWSGGFHHAKKSQATGFCYINDIVLATLELLKFHQRVMYIDIDVHHGDGVEEAFYCTNRVLTLSFHKGGEFFPGTGKVDDIGHEDGKHYSVNVPFDSGIDDDLFFSVFAPVVDRAMERFRPEAVVLQCGADSLAGDRLGCFNLTCKGHGRCVRHVLGKSLPTLILGGGGYTIKNVARCWTYETAVCLGVDLPSQLPKTQFHNYYCPDFELHIAPDRVENCNSRGFLEDLTGKVLENLKDIPIAPSGKCSTPIKFGRGNEKVEVNGAKPRGKMGMLMGMKEIKAEREGEFF